MNNFVDSLEAGGIAAGNPGAAAGNAFAYSNAPSSTDIEKTNIDTLKQYKELLDNGTITQEEFDQAKSKLLDL